MTVKGDINGRVRDNVRGGAYRVPGVNEMRKILTGHMQK